MNKILQDDIYNFTLDTYITDRIANKRFLVTGATGLIGSVFVKCLQNLNLGITFILPVRNRQKAESIFKKHDRDIVIIEDDLVNFFSKSSNQTDYIIHCASPTSGQYMTEHPLETFLIAVESTNALLNYAKKVSCKSIVYLSSIEYYGEINQDKPFDEDTSGYVNHKSLRSSYPLGKQAAEFISFCYAKEYGVNVKTARLTQTFGAGVHVTDNRVFMQFARSIINGDDIVLHTTGKSSKPYCYTTDCVKALLYILLFGKSGEAYNVANPDTYISIKNLAEFLRKEFNPNINIVIDLKGNTNYAPETHTNLCVDKLLKLGWVPQYDLKSMFERLIQSLRE